MKFDTKEILFTSLVGAKSIDQLERQKLVESKQGKQVKKDEAKKPVESMEELWKTTKRVPQNNSELTGEEQFFPLRLSVDEGKTWFLLPYEPLVSINGKNNITRRKVAKVKGVGGTVKEYWSRDDYEITITGILLGDYETGAYEKCFPKEDFEKLKNYMTAAKSIKVQSETFQLLEIGYIVIESFSWPFTKGENVQAYEIKAYSDNSPKLLLDVND